MSAGDAFFVDCLSRVDTLCAQWFATHNRLQIVQPRTTVLQPREMGTGSVLAAITTTIFTTLVVLAIACHMWR